MFSVQANVHLCYLLLATTVWAVCSYLVHCVVVLVVCCYLVYCVVMWVVWCYFIHCVVVWVVCYNLIMLLYGLYVAIWYTVLLPGTLCVWVVCCYLGYMLLSGCYYMSCMLLSGFL